MKVVVNAVVTRNGKRLKRLKRFQDQLRLILINGLETKALDTTVRVKKRFFSLINKRCTNLRYKGCELDYRHMSFCTQGPNTLKHKETIYTSLTIHL
jgi:hypothetical protein